MADRGPGVRTDAAVRLGNGRQLGFATWGDPAGTPVLFFHAAPGSRRLALSSDAVAHELGAWLICVERPGFGLSEPHRGRSILDWPNDVAEFADILGLRSFAVIGQAAGAPYALACGYRLASRVTGVGVVSGFAPPELYDDDELLNMVRDDPDRAKRVVLTKLHGLAAEPEAGVAALSRIDGPDAEVYARPGVQDHLVSATREALRSGVYALATDLWLVYTPWRFTLTSVTAPVRWWHGEHDPLTPMRAATRAVSHLRHATLQVEPGRGHAISFDHGDEILATVASWR